MRHTLCATRVSHRFLKSQLKISIRFYGQEVGEGLKSTNTSSGKNFKTKLHG
jgi:hypothetical protein